MKTVEIKLTIKVPEKKDIPVDVSFLDYTPDDGPNDIIRDIDLFDASLLLDGILWGYVKRTNGKRNMGDISGCYCKYRWDSESGWFSTNLFG